MIILLVHLEMLGELSDTGGKDRDLDFGRTGVVVMGLVGLYNGGLLFFCYRCFHPFFFTYPLTEYPAERHRMGFGIDPETKNRGKPLAFYHTEM